MATPKPVIYSTALIEAAESLHPGEVVIQPWAYTHLWIRHERFSVDVPKGMPIFFICRVCFASQRVDGGNLACRGTQPVFKRGVFL